MWSTKDGEGLGKIICWRQNPPALKKTLKPDQDGESSLRGGTEAKIGKLQGVLKTS